VLCHSLYNVRVLFVRINVAGGRLFIAVSQHSASFDGNRSSEMRTRVPLSLPVMATCAQHSSAPTTTKKFGRKQFVTRASEIKRRSGSNSSAPTSLSPRPSTFFDCKGNFLITPVTYIFTGVSSANKPENAVTLLFLPLGDFNNFLPNFHTDGTLP